MPSYHALNLLGSFVSSYVCFGCRYRPPYDEYNYNRANECPHCHREMPYVHLYLPASRDDHRMWNLAQEKVRPTTTGRSRRRRPRYSVAQRRNGMADWEKQLLKAAKK